MLFLSIVKNRVFALRKIRDALSVGEPSSAEVSCEYGRFVKVDIWDRSR